MDWKTAAIIVFYNDIKSIVENFAGGLGFGIPTDLLLAAIGYWKRNTWWGLGLLYGALANLGSEIGLGTLKLTGAGKGGAAAAAKAYVE